MNADLSALKAQMLQKNYFRKTSFLSYIERPYHYYGDELEINVLSISPSGSGVFIENGLNSGFRDDFEYLAYEQSQPNCLFYLKHLSSKELSFLAFEQGFSRKLHTIQADQKIFDSKAIRILPYTHFIPLVYLSFNMTDSRTAFG